ncbi:FUSC family protein (plasmid) [Coraliomargarita sp. W4R53]
MALFAIGALIAAYFVSRVGVHKHGRQRWSYMVIATVVGVTLSALAILVGGSTLQAMILWPVSIYLAGLSVAYGKSAFNAGYFLVFWVLFAMLAASRSPAEPIYYAASFLLGGVIAIVIMVLRVRFGWIDDAKTEPTSIPKLGDVAKSDIGVFAAMWALTMAVAVGIGYAFWAVEPFWVASTLLVVMQPDVEKGRRTGIQRAIGSTAGGLLAIALIVANPDFAASDLFVIYFLVATALCVMFYAANYLIYAFFMTQAVVAYYGHDVGSFELAGGERVLGVLLGVAIGLIGLGLQSAIIKSRKQRNSVA